MTTACVCATPTAAPYCSHMTGKASTKYCYSTLQSEEGKFNIRMKRNRAIFLGEREREKERSHESYLLSAFNL